MRITSALFVVTAVATANAREPPESHARNHLRGAGNDVYEDRNLLTMGATSKSLSFSWAASAAADQLCFDHNSLCLAKGYELVMTAAGSNASGSAVDFAGSEMKLWLDAYCGAYARAWSRVCAFSKANGSIQVNNKVVNQKQNITLTVNLDTATTAFAMAKSDAVAAAYAGVDAKAFTSVSAFCTQVGNKSPLCAGTASKDLKPIAEARANSKSQSVAVAGSGSSTITKAHVMAQGTMLDYVAGGIMAYATSWSFAKAETTAKAFADAIKTVSSKSFAEVCIMQHGKICGSQPANSGMAICSKTAKEACTSAEAIGQAHAEALSIVCVKAFIDAYAHAQTFIMLSADVDCRSTPKLTWTCTKAGAGTSCTV